jgi:hypothetical protein
MAEHPQQDALASRSAGLAVAEHLLDLFLVMAYPELEETSTELLTPLGSAHTEPLFHEHHLERRGEGTLLEGREVVAHPINDRFAAVFLVELQLPLGHRAHARSSQGLRVRTADTGANRAHAPSGNTARSSEPHRAPEEGMCSDDAMARVSLTLNFGPSAAPAALSDALSAVTVVCGASEVFAELEAQRVAEVTILRDVTQRPGTLRERIEPAELGDDEVSDLNDWIAELQWEAESAYRWAREWGGPPPPKLPLRRLRSLGTRFDLTAQQMPPALQRLVSAEALQLVGDDIAVESLDYSNPLIVVLLAAGFTFSALSVLLGAIRDYGPRRRIANSTADDIEDAARARRRLRRQLLGAHARGDINVPAAELMAALGEAPVEAMAKLMTLDPRIEELHGPNDA